MASATGNVAEAVPPAGGEPPRRHRPREAAAAAAAKITAASIDAPPRKRAAAKSVATQSQSSTSDFDESEPPPPPQRKRGKKRSIPAHWERRNGRLVCRTPGCNNFSLRPYDVCIRHGAVQVKKKCRVQGCASTASIGGICVRHGAKVKKCSHPGCTSSVANNGVCVRHGAVTKRCSVEGCMNRVIQGGLCKRHGAKTKRYTCTVPGCEKLRQTGSGGKCCAHSGQKSKHKRCKVEGCQKFAMKAGLCKGHGAPMTRCSTEGCKNLAKRHGVCERHGAFGERKICTVPSCNFAQKKNGRCLQHKNGERKIFCTVDGCPNKARPYCSRTLGYVCQRHFAKRAPPRCLVEGCQNMQVKGGVCRRHGSHRGVNLLGRQTKRKKTEQESEWDSEADNEIELCSGHFPTRKKTAVAEVGESKSESDMDVKPPARHSDQSRRAAARASARAQRYADDTDDDIDNSDSDSGSEGDDHPIGMTERPSREVLNWIRDSMSTRQQRKHVKSGLRVKVRFEDSVWYGGTIASVLDGGCRVKINFDDGDEEVATFPDDDIVVDDFCNGTHRADASAFVPSNDTTTANESDDEGDDELFPGFTCQPCEPTKANPAAPEPVSSANKSGGSDANPFDDEEELGALIYRYSATAKSIGRESTG